jgi:hypothetical protein
LRLLIVSAVLLSACAPSSSVPRPVAPSTREITRAELTEVRAGDLLDAIQILRPLWIPRRGPPSVDVYLGSERMSGGVLELRSVRPGEVEAVQYLTLGDAQFRFEGAERPAIVVILVGGRR